MTMLDRKALARLALLACSLAVALGGARLASAATPQLTLNLSASGVLEITLPTGQTIRGTASGVSIPGGHYQVIINNEQPDFTDVVHLFHFSGPGINLQTDLGAGDDKTLVFDQVLATNSTYIFQDDRQPGLARVVILTTSATVIGSTTAVGASSTGTSTNSSVVGAKTVPNQGGLLATIPADGAITLTRDGKPAVKIPAGRYAITVRDRSDSRGLVLRHGKTKTVITTAPYRGKTVASVIISKGSWSYGTATAATKAFTATAT